MENSIYPVNSSILTKGGALEPGKLDFRVLNDKIKDIFLRNFRVDQRDSAFKNFNKIYLCLHNLGVDLFHQKVGWDTQLVESYFKYSDSVAWKILKDVINGKLKLNSENLFVESNLVKYGRHPERFGYYDWVAQEFSEEEYKDYFVTEGGYVTSMSGCRIEIIDMTTKNDFRRIGTIRLPFFDVGYVVYYYGGDFDNLFCHHWMRTKIYLAQEKKKGDSRFMNSENKFFNSEFSELMDWMRGLLFGVIKAKNIKATFQIAEITKQGLEEGWAFEYEDNRKAFFTNFEIVEGIDRFGLIFLVKPKNSFYEKFSSVMLNYMFLDQETMKANQIVNYDRDSGIYTIDLFRAFYQLVHEEEMTKDFILDECKVLISCTFFIPEEILDDDLLRYNGSKSEDSFEVVVFGKEKNVNKVNFSDEFDRLKALHKAYSEDNSSTMKYLRQKDVRYKNVSKIYTMKKLEFEAENGELADECFPEYDKGFHKRFAKKVITELYNQKKSE